MSKFHHFGFVCMSLILLAGCGGGGGGGGNGGGGSSNSAPVISSTGSISVTENSTATGYTITATDSNGDSIIFSISGGTDGSLFTVNSVTGLLSFITAPDFDSPADSNGDNVYQVILRASDGSLSSTITVTITVTESATGNSAPVITSTDNQSTPENSVATGYTLTATDADSDPITFGISGGADAGLFTVDSTSGVLSFLSAPDFDSPGDANFDNDYELILEASDSSASTTLAVTISVTDLFENTAPVITSSSSRSTPENSTATGYTLTATDVDGDPLSFSISGGPDSGSFSINSLSGLLTFQSAPDFDAPADSDGDNVYEVNLQASDGTLSDSITVSITVTDSVVLNNAPTITSSNNSSTPENSTATGYTLEANDIDGDPVIFSISSGADSALFSIDPSSGVLSFLSAPDFENPSDSDFENDYQLVLEASDGSDSNTISVTITVTDINENSAPEITSASSRSTPENSTATGYTLTATDDDGDPLTFSISGGDDAALFSINDTSGVLSFLVAPDFDNPDDNNMDNDYELILQASDASEADALAVTITVTDINENSAPEITSASSRSTPENSTATGYTLTATDDDGDPLTFSISGGDDAALFSINDTSGVLSFLVAPDFDDPDDNNMDNDYELILQASDASEADTLAVTITVVEVVIAESLGLTDIDLRNPSDPVDADFYAPEPLVEKMAQDRSVSWTQTSSAPENLTRFSFGQGGSTNIFVLTETSDTVDASLSISSGLAADTSVANDLLLRSLFQFVEVATGQFAIYSTKHGNYAVDVAANGVDLILRDVRSLEAYNAESGSFLTFSVGSSPSTLTANGRYTFDTSASINTIAFEEDLTWTDKVVVLNGGNLDLADSGGTSMALYEPTIGLDIPFDFNPQGIARAPNEEFWDTTRAGNSNSFTNYIANLDAAYSAQVTASGVNASTLAAAETLLDEIETVLASQGSQMRYPREFYLALRDGMLRREILVEESNDGDIGQLTIPYVYFTNETDNNGNYHPHMVIMTHGVPDALALLGDVPHPPGDGLVQGYANQRVTRSYFMENFIIGVPMRDYGEVDSLLENDLATQNSAANPGISLADDRNPTPPYDHHNYASTNESAVAVDGVVVFPSYNAGLRFSQEPGELSVRGMHSGRGLGVHYHADPHSAAFTNAGDSTETGLNLYNESDYIGHDHPPIISIGFDGVAGYGFYLDGDITSDGATVALDDFGGHEHDDYGYHYHSFRTGRQVDGAAINYTTHELGPLGAWAGRINLLPEFRPRGNNNIWLGQ